MRRDRFAKIVATLGLTSSEPETIENLFKAGVDVFRLNFSHGEHAQHKKNIESIRQIEKKLARPITILQDLQGPKFRVSKFVNDKIELQHGQNFSFDQNPELGDNARVYLPHPEIFKAAKIGDKLLIDDARVCFIVIDKTDSVIHAKHIYGNTLSNNKGLNLPDTVLDVSVLTEKDLADLEFGLANGVDYVALSFVQKASDMQALRHLVGNKANILAKIEKPSAVTDIEAIIEASDAIMLARGDLGVEFPPEKLPSIQRHVIQKARNVGKPIIIATQMLESMIDSPIPTRAEATDVDTAISEGADAVMLSGETAIGKYPVEAVSFMNRMIIEAEKDPKFLFDMQHSPSKKALTSESAISLAVKAIVNATDITAIACYTTSGGTAKRLGRERALTPLIALTPDIDIARRLQLYWGIDANVMTNVKQLQEIVIKASTLIKEKKFGKDGDNIIITAGLPFGEVGSTNSLRLAVVGDDATTDIIT